MMPLSFVNLFEECGASCICPDETINYLAGIEIALLDI